MVAQLVIIRAFLLESEKDLGSNPNYNRSLLFFSLRENIHNRNVSRSLGRERQVVGAFHCY